MKKWINEEFTSSSGTTPQWNAFVRDFKKFIKSNLPPSSDLIGWNKGHFYVSGFIQRGGKYVYFSIMDVRGSDWYNRIMIRTAKNEKDFTGGNNCFTTLEGFKSLADSLLERGAF